MHMNRWFVPGRQRRPSRAALSGFLLFLTPFLYNEGMAGPENETDYAKMTAEQQARFATEHFDRLTPEQQTRVAIDDFDKGRILNAQEAGIVDKALGNGDGVFDEKDLKKIEDDRNDKAFNQALAAGATMMVDVARDGFLNAMAPDGFKLGLGGALAGMFANSASGSAIGALGSPGADLTEPSTKAGFKISGYAPEMP